MTDAEGTNNDTETETHDYKFAAEKFIQKIKVKTHDLLTSKYPFFPTRGSIIWQGLRHQTQRRPPDGQ